MGVLLNRRRYMGRGGSLPYDAEIEYLEGTGTQYIDTLFYPRTTLTDITVENKFNKSVQSGDHCVLGARTGINGSQGFKLPNFYNKTLEYQGLIPANASGNITTFNIDTDYTSLVEIKQGSQKVYVDGVLKIEQYNFGNCDAGGNLYLFAMHQSGVKWFFNGKIYYCKIWQDDVIERDYIPVRVGTTGYMYDKVSGRLFGNLGTGSFSLGPDK